MQDNKVFRRGVIWQSQRKTFMIIDHSAMETENYRKTVRKSLAHIYGNIEAIEESGARVIGKNVVNFYFL
jgi:hypothetical protein